MQKHSAYKVVLGGVVATALVVVVWGASVEAQDEPETPQPPRAKVAALLNLSPWQSWVHLFCERTTAPGCGVTFWCGQMTGDPVTWNITVEPGLIFTYWPGKTDPDGRPAGLEAALVDAGLNPDAARRRTTCLVRSNDPVEVRAYTRTGGEVIPVANKAGTSISADGYAPADQAAYDALVVGRRGEWDDPMVGAFDVIVARRFYQTVDEGRTYSYEGSYTYEKTGADTGTVTTDYGGGLTCATRYTFTSRTGGTGSYTCSDGRSGGPSNVRLVEIPSPRPGYAAADQAAFHTLVVGRRFELDGGGARAYTSPGQFTDRTAQGSFSGRYTWQNTGRDTGTLTLTYNAGLVCTFRHTYVSPARGAMAWTCSDGRTGADTF